MEALNQNMVFVKQFLFAEVRTRAGYIENKVWPPLPGAVFCEEDDGGVRIVGNGCLSKVSKIDQVVLVVKKPEMKLRKTMKTCEDLQNTAPGSGGQTLFSM